jgi:hypothetical protein
MSKKRLSKLQIRQEYSFRDSRRTKRLKPDGLKSLKPRIRAELEARRKKTNVQSKLHEQVLAPLGRLVDKPAREAMGKLHSLQEKEFQQAKLFDSNLVRNPGFRTMAAWTQPGSTWVYPPLDDEWTDREGNAGTVAHKDNGYIWTSVSASDGDSQYAAAGALLWIVPQSAANTILLFPYLHGGYYFAAHTSWGPTAHSDGYLNFLIRTHDGQDRVIDQLTIDQREQLWSVGTSGVDDSEQGHDYNFERDPFFVLRGGAYYEAWFWIQNFADSGSSFWGGRSWAQGVIAMNFSRANVAQI